MKINKKEIFTVDNVPIFAVGTWKDIEFTIADLDEIVTNTNSLINANLMEPPVKLGHSENQEILGKEGLPAAGYVKNVYRLGDQIFANFRDVPKQILAAIEKRNYSKVSAEIYQDFEHPKTKEKIGKVLRAVALLGADIPEVKGLGDIQKLSSENDKYKYNYISFSEDNFKEVDFMNLWTLKEVEKTLPCCVEEVRQYFSEHKVETIDQEKLAELIQLKRFKNFQEEPKEPECPSGFKWDAVQGKCIETSATQEKVDTRKVCPKGFEWDETAGKCIAVEAAKEKPAENPADKEPKNLTDEEKNQLTKLILKATSEEIDKIKKFLSGETITALKVTENEEKAKETKKLGEDQKVTELMEKVKMLEKEKLDKMVLKLKEDNKDILLPKFDAYIDLLFSEIYKQEKTVKFGEKEASLFEVFHKFLNELVKNKRVIFDEISKTPQNTVEMSEDVMEKKETKIKEKYNSVRKDEEVTNIKLAIFAEEIARKENIAYSKALVKASKILATKSE